MAGSVVLVEGESDQRALATLAPRLEVAEPTIVVMHGITNLRAHLRHVPRDVDVRLLHDAGESAYVARVLGQAAQPGLVVATSVCDADLEGELIRAVGVEGMLAVVDAQGERTSYERMAQQPAQRDRSDHQRLHRWLGARSGHKRTYAGLLAAAVAVDRVPAPLRDVLADGERPTTVAR